MEIQFRDFCLAASGTATWGLNCDHDLLPFSTVLTSSPVQPTEISKDVVQANGKTASLRAKAFFKRVRMEDVDAISFACPAKRRTGGRVEAFLVRRVEAVRLIVIGVQPDWHQRCINAANGTSCWKVDGRLLDEIGRTSYVLERLLKVDFGPMQRPPFSFDERDTLVNIDSYTVEGSVTARSCFSAQLGHAS